MAILTNSGRGAAWSRNNGVASAQYSTIFSNSDVLILNNVN